MYMYTQISIVITQYQSYLDSVTIPLKATVHCLLHVLVVNTTLEV